MCPRDVWDALHIRSFGEPLVLEIIEQLVQVNVSLNRITVLANGNLLVTPDGRNWGTTNCNRIV